MKRTNTIVMVIVAAAVLIAAYAVGLLIRHARTQRGTPDAARTPQTLVDQHAPGGRRVGREPPVDTRPQKEALLEKVNSMTEEEKRKFTQEQVLDRVNAKSSRGPSRRPSAQEQTKTLQGTSTRETEKSGAEPNTAGRK